MSGEDVRKVSCQDRQLVWILIGRCLQRYMHRKEVVDTLSVTLLHYTLKKTFSLLGMRFQNLQVIAWFIHSWSVGFLVTSVILKPWAVILKPWANSVWQKLEEENRAFFKAYYLRLMLKNQITAFNKLLEDQYQLMNKDYSSGVPSMPLPNGYNSNPLKQNSCFLQQSATISAMPNGVMRNGSSSGVVNGTPSSDQLMYAGKDIHGLHSGMNASTSLLSAQNISPVLFGADNGTTIKTESGYSSNADFAFCGNAFLESCQSIGDASAGSFSSSELNGQPLSDSILDIESSFGFFSQISQNFSFSDFTEGFNQSAEMLENYG